VGIPACDRDRLCSEILHTGTMKLGREWSLPSWHQLGQCFQGKCHLRLKNGLQKNKLYAFWCRFQWKIHWNKSGGSHPPVAWDMAVWSWWRTFGAPGKERVKVKFNWRWSVSCWLRVFCSLVRNSCWFYSLSLLEVTWTYVSEHGSNNLSRPLKLNY